MNRPAGAACAIAMMVLSLVRPGITLEQHRDVVFTADGDGGTVTVIDAETFSVLHTINVIPEGNQPPPQHNPAAAATYSTWVRLAGENFAQDLAVSPDGTVLYVSRGHYQDVAAFDLRTDAILWRTPILGVRADHMEMSADGTRLFVSAMTVNVVEVLDTETGMVAGVFPAGDWPHDNLLSPDGKRVYNGSLGVIPLPGSLRNNRPEALDALPHHPNQLTIVDAETLQVIRRDPFPRGIRPFVLTADEKTMYVQLSLLHGFVEYDLDTRTILRTIELPVAEGVTSADWDFEAPHHGIDLSPDERYLCIAGRASDYAAIVSVETMEPVKIIPVDDAPGAAHNGPTGKDCWVASTRANTVSVISYETLEKVAVIPTGLGPKHLTHGHVPMSVLEAWE